MTTEDPPADVLLELEHVQKTFQRGPQRIQALDDVSLKLMPGDYLAIRGPSGCGKSTLLLTAGGLLRPDAGQIQLLGEAIYELSPNRRAEMRAAGIGFVFQQFHLVPYLTVLDNVLAVTLGLPAPSGAASSRPGASQPASSRPGMTAGTANGSGDVESASSGEVAREAASPSNRAKYRERALELLERFGLADRRWHVPARLSVGERQRTALARALLNEPRIILADEPTGNLDDANAEIVWQVLADFAAQGGGVLLVTHDQRAAGIARQTFEMNTGKLLDPARAKEPV